jgi:hypothetical protein
MWQNQPTDCAVLRALRHTDCRTHRANPAAESTATGCACGIHASRATNHQLPQVWCAQSRGGTVLRALPRSAWRACTSAAKVAANANTACACAATHTACGTTARASSPDGVARNVLVHGIVRDFRLGARQPDADANCVGVANDCRPKPNCDVDADANVDADTDVDTNANAHHHANAYAAPATDYRRTDGTANAYAELSKPRRSNRHQL